MIEQHYAIFDMDGTLVDSMPYWRNILAEYLEMPIPKEYAEKIAALTVSDSIALTVKEYKLTKNPKVIFDEICEIMYNHYVKDVSIKEGVVQYLQKLQDKNVRMCIASASPQFLIKTVMKKFDIADYFEFICSTEDGFADKRNPDIFLYCADKFKSTPPETAVFEDSYSAIRAALKANFHVVAIYDKSQDKYWDEITRSVHRSKLSYTV